MKTNEDTNQPTNQTNNSMDRVILEKLPVPQLVKQLPAFYGTWSFITMLTAALVPVLNQINLVYTLPSHFFKLHYNIILQSMLMSYKWALSLHVSQPKSCMHFTCLCLSHLSWFYLPRHCFMSSTYHAACHYASLPPTRLQIPSSAPYPCTFLAYAYHKSDRPSQRLHHCNTKVLSSTLPKGSLVPRFQTEGSSYSADDSSQVFTSGLCQQARSACWRSKYFGTWTV